MRRRLVGVTATPVTSRDSSQYRLKNPGNVPGRRDAFCVLGFWAGPAGDLARATASIRLFSRLSFPSLRPLFRLGISRSFQIEADVAREKVKPGRAEASASPRNGLNVESLSRMVSFFENQARGMERNGRLVIERSFFSFLLLILSIKRTFPEWNFFDL